jgi:hypothetical protein
MPEIFAHCPAATAPMLKFLSRPGRCCGESAEMAVLAGKASTIGRYLAQVAATDRAQAIAAIHSVRQLAAN